MKCTHCSFDNLPGVTVCQVCGTRLTGIVCTRCNFENPPDYRFCGNCGQPLPEIAATSARPAVRLTPAAPAPLSTEPVNQSATPPPPAPTPNDNASKGPSSIALVGFGAILALASASYPWYLFGLYGDTQEATLSEVLQDGWQWFPGLPLVLIAASAVTSTIVSMANSLTRIRPIVALVSGFITLFSATWLWQGYSQFRTGDSSGGVVPGTGPMLAIIGAIVLIAVGLWGFQRVRSK